MRFRCPTCAYCAAQNSTLEPHIIRKHRPVSGEPARGCRLRSHPRASHSEAIQLVLPASETLRCCGQIRPAACLQAQHKRRQVAPRSSETPQSGSFVSSADLAVLAEQIEVELSMEVLEPATAPEA